MPKKPKTHVKDPRDWNRSLCGRITVIWADPPKSLTCNHCTRMINDGRWAKFERARKKHKAKSFNNQGIPKLTPKQLQFAQHPEVMINPHKAAVDVGYSEGYAKNAAKRMRKQLGTLIMEYQEKAAERAIITKAKVQTELSYLAFANLKDYFVEMTDGMVVPKSIDELTREQAAAVQEYTLSKTPFPDGKFRLVSIKLADKRANLVDLGKTLGMFDRTLKIEDKRKAGGLGEVPTEALEAAEKYLMAAAQGVQDKLGDRKAITAEFTPVESPDEG